MAQQQEGKIWSRNEIRDLLKSNDNAVLRAVVAIYKYQTDHERIAESTIVHNGVGFNAFDASSLSSLAKRILRKERISQREIQWAREKMLKYSGQLERIANSR